MFFDLRPIPDQSNFDCDLCIIGGGAAGIAMALEFIGTGIEVLLLESGGFELEVETQKLYQGDDIGLPYFDLEYARLRYFGGTTNHWAGMCAPLDPIDFKKRDWVNYSGWPIEYSDFASYLPRASTICELPGHNFDAEYWLRVQGEMRSRNYEYDKKSFEAFSEFFNAGAFPHSPPTRFGETYRQKLEMATNVKILLNANVTSIDTLQAAHKVDQISVKTLSGKSATVTPKQVTLATGGVENARVLLASNKTHSQGIGNKNDLVGRFFADHIELESGFILSSKHTEFFDIFFEGFRPTRFSLNVAPEIQNARKMVNIGMTIHNVSNEHFTANGIGAARRMKQSIDNGKWPDNFFSDVGSAIMDMDDIISYMWTRDAPKKEGLYMIMNRVESQPNPNSRITLSDDRDALDIPTVKLDWQLSELDYYSIYEMQKMFGKTLGQSGYGRINIELEEKYSKWPGITQGGHHHMGTTRMAETDKTGVVDKNSKVFGIENLYVAGSSIFPTYGKANPTLNLVALTLRLADHLKEKMGAVT